MAGLRPALYNNEKFSNCKTCKTCLLKNVKSLVLKIILLCNRNFRNQKSLKIQFALNFLLNLEISNNLSVMYFNILLFYYAQLKSYI